MLFYGIDPGVSGGFAALNEHGHVCAVSKAPETDRDICDWLETAGGMLADPRPVHAYIEKVNPGVFARPGAKMGVVSAFTFGGGYRALKMALTATRIPYDEVLPVKWQTAMGCRSGGDKNITKARAQALFPEIKVTHATADALLIAEFCRRIRTGAKDSPAAPQLEMLNGEEELDGAEATEAISQAFQRLQRKDEAREGAPQAAAEGTAGDGEPRHRGNRKGRARLR